MKIHPAIYFIGGAIVAYLVFNQFQIPIMQAIFTQSIIPTTNVADPYVVGGIISALGGVVAAVIGGGYLKK